jgi:iron complex outermembrane receptor protein
MDMKRQHRQETQRFKAFLLLGAAFLCSPALAQTNQAATPSDPALSEVVVTAQRVSEPLQKTPAAVSVLSADALETAGVQNFNDVAQLVPNLVFTTGYRAGVPQISMRGIPNVQGGEAPVAFVVDGVQVPALDFVNQDLLDIANVQVLHGPQGGLYGRNALGGAVIVETQRPTDKFEDTLTVDWGNGGMFRAVNSASGPLVPGQLWGKVTLEGHYFNGLIQNTGTGKPADSVRDFAGRVELLAKPTDTTTIDLTYAHTQAKEGIGYYANLTNYSVEDFKRVPPNFDFPSYDNRYLNTYTAKIDQETPIGIFTSISQYAQTQSTVIEDVDWTTDPIVVAIDPVTVKAFNEDVHLASPANQPLQWIVGGFYQLRQTVNDLNVYYEQLRGGNPFCGCAGGPGEPALLDNDHNNSLAWAVYGQASIPLPDDFKLNFAMRYDSDRRTDQDLSIPAGPTNAISHTFGAFQPSGSLQKQITPDLMAYVSAGKGFSSGGFNAYSDVVGSGGFVPREFPQETVVSYEAGIKSQFLNHHLTINADYFHSTFKNEQYFLYLVSPPARDVLSIKSVTFNGGELEVNYVPMDGLTLGASGGIAASNINSNDPFQNDLNKQSPGANLYNADLSAVYRQPLWGGDYNALFRVDYSYKGPIC